MIGAKRWDTREGASMWVPSYYPGSCVSQSSALLPWSLIAAVFTSSGIIFIIFTSPLTGSCAALHRLGAGGMWHVTSNNVMTSELCAPCRQHITGDHSDDACHQALTCDQCDIIMTSAWQRKSINNPLLWQQCPDSDEADTALMVSDVSIMTAMSLVPGLMSCPSVTIIVADIDPGRNIYQMRSVTSDNVLVTLSA